jgi:hypothetical protein
VELLGPHFKKIALFEQGFNVRAMVPTMGDTQDPTVILEGLGECKEFVQKGIKRFSVRNK